MLFEQNSYSYKEILRCLFSFKWWRSRLEIFLSNFKYFYNFDLENKNFCFIVSTGRTGTTYLADHFNQYSNVLSLHEPYPHLLRLGDNVAKGLNSDDFILKKIQSSRNIIFRKYNLDTYSHYIEANNRLFSLLPFLTILYNNPNFIYVIRDPRNVVRSAMCRDHYKDNDRSPRIQAIDFPEDPFFHLWDEMDRFEKVCWWVFKENDIIYQSLKNYDNKLIVKFEDLFDKHYSGIKSIASFISLNFQEKYIKKQKINKNISYDFDSYEDWTKKHKIIFNKFFKECKVPELISNYYNR
jgi:hypothetical protein